MQKYFGFDGYEDMVNSFFPSSTAEEIPKGFPRPADIIVADYDTPAYEGYAFVLYRRKGKKDAPLFEVNASHCSCYGLEGQWEPEETSVGALKMRKFEDSNVKAIIDRL